MTTTSTIKTHFWYPNNEPIETADVTPILAEDSNKLIFTEKVECPAVAFEDIGLLKAIPTNLKEFAPNIHTLEINECGLTKISREDLKGLGCLRNLYLIHMAIEELPAKLFADLHDLEIVSFACNKIRYIDRNIFKHLRKLKFANLRDNLRLDVVFSIQEIYFPTDIVRAWTLEQLNSLLAAVFPPPPASTDIEKILKSETFKDFTIKVGEEEIKVHKLLLAARSSTFAYMIKNNPNADELILEDVEPGVFRVILNYIYNNDMPAGYDEMTEKIFVAAGKLKLEQLMEKVGDILCSSVTPQSSIKLLILASTYGHESLKMKAFDALKKFLSKETLPESLMNNLEVLSEMYQVKKAYEEKMNQAIEKIEGIGICEES